MTDFETEHIDMDESEMDDSDRLLYEVVVRLSALESALIKNGTLLEADLAEAQVGCMQKIKEVLDAKKQSENSTSGFIKYGERFEDYNWSHESDDKGKR